MVFDRCLVGRFGTGIRLQRWLAVGLVAALALATLTISPAPSVSAGSEPVGRALGTARFVHEAANGLNVPSLATASAATQAAGVQFVPNVGQIDDPSIRFYGRAPGGHLAFHADGWTFALASRSPQPEPNESLASLGSPRPNLNAEAPFQTAQVRVSVLEAAQLLDPALEERRPGVNHYYIGDDPTKWREHVPTYGVVRYREIYPGIDLVFKGDGPSVKNEWVARPGADTSVIRLALSGDISRVWLDWEQALRIATPIGELIEGAPVVYQCYPRGTLCEPTDREAVAAGYVLDEHGVVGFRLGQYDPSRALIIDPTIGYSSYLGGVGSDTGAGIAVDAAGNVYVTGSAETGFPMLQPFQGSISGPGSDAFVTKLNQNGAPVFSSYLGGSNVDSAHGIAVDSVGNAFVVGNTSGGFPTLNAFQAAPGGSQDAFVAKVNANGTLGYSSYLGGTTADSGLGIAVDPAGNAYVTGITFGAFPTANAFQNTFGGVQDAFVTKVNGNGTLGYSSYLGGTTADAGQGITVDSAGNVYVVGITQGNFPTANAFQGTFGGGAADAFITKVNVNGTLGYSSYLGGTATDFGLGIAVDPASNVYVTGYTTGSFPTLNPFQGTIGGVQDAFVAKVNANGTLGYSSYLGGNTSDTGLGIAADAAGNAYVTGITNGNFTLLNPFQNTFGGVQDAIVAKVNANGTLGYSSYLGGSNLDFGNAIAVDAAGNVYVTGETSGSFPLVNPFQPQFGGNANSDAIVVKIKTDGAGPLAGGLDTLIPISPPIRVLDTRNPPTGFDAATGNPIAAGAFLTNQTRGYRLASKTFGAFTFPTTFRAVLATVSLVDTAPAGGFVTVAGVNPPPPGVATALPQGTAAAPFISSTFAFTQVDAGGNFYVFNVGATRQIIVDIVGYYP